MTKVLVVDDSQFMQTVIGSALSEHGYEVETADDGEAAVQAVVDYEPDVVTMDVQMPGMDGIEATERIMERRPTRILMLSVLTKTGADATLQALARGAVDFLPKTDEEMAGDIDRFQDALVEKVRAVESADLSSVVNSQMRAATRATAPAETAATSAAGAAGAGTESVADDSPAGGSTPAGVEGPAVEPIEGPEPEEAPTVVVGASTGGPRVVERVLAELPADLSARVLVVQHMPASFTDRLATRLDEFSEYDVREAADGARLADGEALVAKGGYHMRVSYAGPNHCKVRLTEEERVHGVRPAIDVTMETAAEEVEGPLVGAVLTGMGRDGAAGVSAVKAAGGHTIAQDEETALVHGIPGKAIETGDVDRVVPATSVAGAIVDAVTGGETDG